MIFHSMPERDKGSVYEEVKESRFVKGNYNKDEFKYAVRI